GRKEKTTSSKTATSCSSSSMSEGRSRDSGLGTRDAGREAKALWLCCPHCKGTLSFESERCRCAGCGRVFPVLFGIPDLRGPGGFLAAAASRFSLAAGIDVSMTWLLVTRRRLEEAGATASLACACAERLPVPDGHFDAVVAQDVLEHVGDRQAVLAEMDRVT